MKNTKIAVIFLVGIVLITAFIFFRINRSIRNDKMINKEQKSDQIKESSGVDADLNEIEANLGKGILNEEVDTGGIDFKESLK